MSLFHVMAHQFGHLPLPCCQSSWAFSSRIQALKTSLVNHWAFVFFLCWVSVNCRNYYMIAIELIMFPIFCMNCYTKLLKNFILYIVTLNKPWNLIACVLVKLSHWLGKDTIKTKMWCNLWINGTHESQSNCKDQQRF